MRATGAVLVLVVGVVLLWMAATGKLPRLLAAYDVLRGDPLGSESGSDPLNQANNARERAARPTPGSEIPAPSLVSLTTALQTVGGTSTSKAAPAMQQWTQGSPGFQSAWRFAQ